MVFYCVTNNSRNNNYFSSISYLYVETLPALYRCCRNFLMEMFLFRSMCS